MRIRYTEVTGFWILHSGALFQRGSVECELISGCIRNLNRRIVSVLKRRRPVKKNVGVG